MAVLAHSWNYQFVLPGPNKNLFTAKTQRAQRNNYLLDSPSYLPTVTNEVNGIAAGSPEYSRTRGYPGMIIQNFLMYYSLLCVFASLRLCGN
jgi:hypothetical protein